jgi:hypothetical protein
VEYEGKEAADHIGVAVKKIGGRVLNGVVERHLGISDLDIYGPAGMAGLAVTPILQDAYAARPDEPFLMTWQRRICWSLGIAGTVALIGGSAYLAWKYLGKSKDED